MDDFPTTKPMMSRKEQLKNVQLQAAITYQPLFALFYAALGQCLDYYAITYTKMMTMITK